LKRNYVHYRQYARTHRAAVVRRLTSYSSFAIVAVGGEVAGGQVEVSVDVSARVVKAEPGYLWGIKASRKAQNQVVVGSGQVLRYLAASRSRCSTVKAPASTPGANKPMPS
jgi:hypothetical protein